MNAPLTQPLSHSHAGYPSDFSAGPHFRWTARAVGDLSQVPTHIRGRSIPATVPGCIHTDLMDAGLIPDPAIGMNENEVQWVSWTDWCYELIFEADPRLFDHHEIDLVCECLDTIAAIELNGHTIGHAASEFIPHRFSVLGLLNKGENRLAVTFTSPLRFVHDQARKLGPLPVNGDWDPYCYLRKCASNFRWDWGPKVATCGITAPVAFHGWSTSRLGPVCVRPIYLNSSTEEWGISVTAEACWAGDRPADFVRLRATVFEGNGQISSSSVSPNEAGLCVRVRRPAVWRPAGSGEPNTTPLCVELSIEDTAASNYAPRSGAVLDKLDCRIGFREVWPYSYYFRGQETFPLIVGYCGPAAKGANWIPEGLWPRDRSYARVRRRLEQARDAGMNMIRVWGGGRYEPDWFYDICDELGLMVWQDFMFSCACYPEEEPYRTLIEQEARHQVARLSRHPSVVLWCGGNECEWAHESWGFKEKLKESGQASRGWGQLYYRDLLPRIVAELAPGTPYIPNSPYSPTPGKHPNDADEGDRHTWDLVGDDFRKHVPHFCSEFGVQSPSTRETLSEANLLPPTELSRDHEGGAADPDATSTSPSNAPLPTVLDPSTAPPASITAPAGIVLPALLARQRGPGGMQRWYDEPLAKLFAPAKNVDEWLAQTHEMQARHLYTAIVWLRANDDTCSGVLIWQLNDAWPGLSWSLIDSAGREKPAYDAVKRAFAPRLIEVIPFDGRPHLVIINDTDEAWAGGHTIDGRDIPFEVKPRAVSRIPLITGLRGWLSRRGEH